MRKASLGTIFLTVFLDLLGFGMVIPFLPGVARHLGASDLVASLTGSVYSLMQFLLVPVWGRLSDRIGRRPILLTSIAATAAGMALLGVANSLFLLFAARIFTGIATANIAVAQAYIADVTPPEGRARGMGLIGLAFGLGFIFGPFFGGELARLPLHGHPGALPAFAAAGLSLINLVMATLTLPESLPPERRGTAAAASRHRSSPFDFASVKRALATPDVGRALTINFLVVFWFAGMEQTFRLFTDDAFHMSDAATGGLFGLVGVVAAIVQGGLIGRLTRRFGEVRLLTIGLAVQAAGFALLGASPRLPFGSRTALALSCVLIAGGSGLVTPSVSSYVSRQAGSDVQGLTLGTLQSLSALARVLGPAVGGLLYQAIAIPAPYFAGALGMVLAAWLSFGLSSLTGPAKPLAAAEATAPPLA
ncbi:MAG TPA: MFS transporter [Polyangia bacterium]|jgi:MFS family permease